MDSHSKTIPPSDKPCTSIPPNLLPSAPASPPTPAPSPTPHQRVPSWRSSEQDEDPLLFNTKYFESLSGPRKQQYLEAILSLCSSQQLSFVSSYVAPRLRKDPFLVFPTEISLRVLSFVDDPKTLARASQVSSRWHELLNDDITWKNLCERHAFTHRRPAEDNQDLIEPIHNHRTNSLSGLQRRPNSATIQSRDGFADFHRSLSGDWSASSAVQARRLRVRPLSYKYHFKQKYMIESAWSKGGRCTQRHISPDQGVVTSLHLTPKYIVASLDNAKIHVYDTNGENQKTLEGHVMGVWAMVPWDDILVSGGCDREVRVWNMATGESIYLLRGHTSTVRCLKMSDKNTAISGSRDTTLRIWDLRTGTCRSVLVGHQASVRCLAVHGDIVVSGSYDTTARVWSISEGRFLRALSGHFSQIYAIAFDGRRIATGSLDTSVRVWDPNTGQCHAILQGHTSLVGQLQMSGDTLVTGGSDGSVRVWSLTRMAPIHRLAAHDNSVTSLQFDNNRIVSGGSDGRVKVWCLRTGQLLRELSTPSDTVWRVTFEEEKAVIMSSRSGRTVMEVWSFSPPLEDKEFDAATIGVSSSISEPTPARSNRSLRPLVLSDPPHRSDGDQLLLNLHLQRCCLDLLLLRDSHLAPPAGQDWSIFTAFSVLRSIFALTMNKTLEGAQDTRFELDNYNLRNTGLIAKLATPVSSKAFLEAGLFSTCDEALPECGNCRVYGRPCPGYRLESIFRNETSKVEQLVKRSGSLVPSSSGSQRGRRFGRDASTGPSLTVYQVADSTWGERALCYFFDQYTSGDDPDEAMSYLSFLPSFYTACRENGIDNATPASTCLRLAVDATALMTLSNHVNAPPLVLRAREYYGRALRGLQQALTTKTQAVKDETFATMVLLALFEDITGERNGLASSHAAGFELLMKLRGEDQLGHARGRDLFHFAYTHTHVELLALRGRPHYNTDWIVERLSGADPIARLILIASKISQLFLATSSLQASAVAAASASVPDSTTNTGTGATPDSISQLSLLLLTGRQIDLELTSWSQDLPERWLPLVIYPDKSSKFNTLTDDYEPLITYHHLSIASVWTYYRAVRIVSHLIMLELRRALAAAAGTSASIDDSAMPTAAQATPAIIQKQILDICRSIPFCLGDVDIKGNRTTSPSAGSERDSKPQPRARAFSVYSMIWPLWYILSCGLATPAQEDHIRNCLARIGSVLGIKLALVLAQDAESQRRPPISLEGLMLGGPVPGY
ncbi:uncharacterized protein DSM5745_02203 [Aspergillus mulundensis]|uniref:Probable E3 ubiquitin ligase complex SCF subunit sconB n=1 Tax=Aspergillus mulundensis TaxID=1810919 RepID=A0A3D8SXC8_9EURO|nr:hypothetical protein DSM5745_02203 [Aspergillus mulundensis]RDW90428.1 hypothetical protein DSM5745_02203 [Aspergillus mulundensis]